MNASAPPYIGAPQADTERVPKEQRHESGGSGGEGRAAGENEKSLADGGVCAKLMREISTIDYSFLIGSCRLIFEYECSNAWREFWRRCRGCVGRCSMCSWCSCVGRLTAQTIPRHVPIVGSRDSKSLFP